MRKWGFLLTAAVTTVALTSCGGTTETESGESPAASASRLNSVKDRGQLICGVEGTIPGFSSVESDGSYTGLDVDICKAVAAAV